MSGFFARLKNIFSRKPKTEQTQSMEQPKQAEPALEIEDLEIEDGETVPVKVEEKFVKERKEKMCPFCNAPNDTFVGKCWLCKKAI